jgi:hypothetical protein
MSIQPKEGPNNLCEMEHLAKLEAHLAISHEQRQIQTATDPMPLAHVVLLDV